jgi:hypothetical protein
LFVSFFQLYNTPTYDEFVALLLASAITNREHVGYVDLIDRIGGADGAGCAARLPKLALLITGRDIGHESKGAVWANGNFAPGDSWKKFQSVFAGPAEKACLFFYLCFFFYVFFFWFRRGRRFLLFTRSMECTSILAALLPIDTSTVTRCRVILLWGSNLSITCNRRLTRPFLPNTFTIIAR